MELIHPRPRSALAAPWLVPLAALLGAGTLLGLATNLAKLAIGAGLHPLTFLSWSLFGATLVLAGVNRARGRRLPLTRPTVTYLLSAAVLSVVGPNLILYNAVAHVGVGFVALCVAFPPLFTYLGAMALRLERYQPSRALGVMLALGGATLLAALKLSAPSAAVGWIVSAMATPLIFAAGNIYRTVRWPQGARASDLAPGMLAVATAMLFLVGLGGAFPVTLPTDRPLPLGLVGVQVVAFAAQYLLFFVVQQRGGPVYLSLLGSVGAVVAMPVATLLLGEAPLAGLAPAGVLIAAGIALLVNRRSRS